MSVGVLAGLLEADAHRTPGEENQEPDLSGAGVVTGETHGLGAADAKNVVTAWSWLEHYVTQVFINLRDLYMAVSGGSDLPANSFLGRMRDIVSARFSLPPGDFASIAAITDSMKQLTERLTVENDRRLRYVFYRGTTVPPVQASTVAVDIPASITATAHLVDYQLWRAMKDVPAVNAANDTYRQVITQTVKASDWGGPLA